MQRNGLNGGTFTTGQGYTAGTFGMIDNMAYTYGDSNRVMKVLDASLLTKGFKSKNNVNDRQYSYDKNGNMTGDVNKEITNIEYNYLNLPQKITFGRGGITMGIIIFVYDASGVKLRKIVQEIHQGLVMQSTTYDYVNGVEYKNNSLERIANTEGAVTKNASGVYEYEYVLRDHLGNTRATFSDANNDGTVTSADIKQINHYYPFGMNMEGNWTPKGANGEGNKYQYNGKEWNDDFGLGWNHHDWRFLDVAINRFVTVDPMADEEEQESYSPYHFAADNPIRYSDPDGRNPVIPIFRVLRFIWATTSASGTPMQMRQAASAAKELNQARSLTVVRDATSTMIKPVILKNDGVTLNPSNSEKSKEQKIADAEKRAEKLSKKDRSEKDFTPAGKEAVIDLDKAINDGKTICTTCGVETIPAEQDVKGVVTPGNRTEVDHIKKKRDGGSGTPDNGRVRCRNCNNNDDRPAKQ